ncbi:MAG: hypothetical protein WCV88_02060 [Patescibacteria group bacterium]|jgi:chromosome segregation ATPase
MPDITLSPNVKLQPVPPVTPVSATPDRRSAVQAELEKLQQEENTLLGNMKDWISKIQGSETRQQALERELFELDRQTAAVPDNTAQIAQLKEVLQKQNTQLKEVVRLQKIDEKKAFDNYSAGGLDRQGLLDEMDHINQRYADQLTDLQKKVQATKTALATFEQPEPTQQPVEAIHELPLQKPASGLMTKLSALPAVQPLLNKQPTILRSNTGNGIVIRSGTEELTVTDAELLMIGATAEDIISLPGA